MGLPSWTSSCLKIPIVRCKESAAFGCLHVSSLHARSTSSTQKVDVPCLGFNVVQARVENRLDQNTAKR